MAGKRVHSLVKSSRSRTRMANSSGLRRTITTRASADSSPTLVPATILVGRYFVAEQKAIGDTESELAATEQQLDEQKEEQGGEDGLLEEVVEGEGDKQKITAKAL